MRGRTHPCTPKVTGVSELLPGYVASVGEDGRLISYGLFWNYPKPYEILNIGQPLSMVARLDNERLVVTDYHGRLWVVWHDDGVHLENAGSQKLHSKRITDIVIHSELVVTGSMDCTTKVWHHRDLAPLATLAFSSPVFAMALNETYLMPGCMCTRKAIRREASDFNACFEMFLAICRPVGCEEKCTN